MRRWLITWGGRLAVYFGACLIWFLIARIIFSYVP